MEFIGEKVPAFIVNTPLRSYANISLEIHLREFTKACVVTVIGQKSNDSVLFFYDKDGMCLHVDIQVKNVQKAWKKIDTMLNSRRSCFTRRFLYGSVCSVLARCGPKIYFCTN